MRFVVAVLLAAVVAFHLLGFAFLAFGWWIGAEVHVRGGIFTLVVSAVITVVCFRGVRRLLAPAGAALETAA